MCESYHSFDLLNIIIMRYITFADILLFSLIFCFIVALIAQIAWISISKKRKRPNIFRLTLGTCITAVCSSVVVAIFMTIFMPSVYIVGENDYEERMFISSKLLSQLSKEYIYNQSGETLYFKAVGYGSDKYVEESIRIMPGKIEECEHSVHGYNTMPPNSIWSKASGEIHWYLFSDSYMSKTDLH